ncbi:zinc finger protein 846-like isoform X3 [Zerene cesonia]|uniref:zinc finger protein 846-like isoform X3 n=1 Tax=Zerene cesonia TaxID=33412 RepID=UPI0018E4FBBF|nr:zinc finger protein 846-like isoform X3 [Zerene cesonia]
MNNEGNNEIVILDAAGPSNILIEKLDENCQQPASSGPEDFSFMCRICALKTRNIMNLFEDEGAEQKLVEKINKYLPLKVSQGDGLPEVICYQCSNAVLAWHELVECCMQADASFRKQLVLAAQGNGISSTTKGSVNHLDEDSLKWIYNTECDASDDNNLKYATEFSNGILNGSDTSVDNDSDREPLSNIATRKMSAAYGKFYNALVNFRNHFVEEHKKECNYPDFTESSSEEEAADGFDVDTYDDLTLCNMRRDKMDDQTRLELNEVQTKVNGKVFYTCRICGKNLSSSHTYLFHKKIHTGERPCVCHVCGKTFRAPNGLQRHLKETHEKVKSYVCAICAKTFVNSQNLRQHMRIHTGERPYVCAQCGKRFTQSGSLHVHLKTHSDLFPFNCTECGAQFRLRAGLTKHKLKHTGERPHVCTSCGKGFRQKHELNSHALTHSNAKPFSCTVCGATFRQRRALRHHTKRLHDTTNVSCHVYSQVPY